MNTKKVLFGLLALGFFAMATTATVVVDEDVLSQQTEIKKKGMRKF